MHYRIPRTPERLAERYVPLLDRISTDDLHQACERMANSASPPWSLDIAICPPLPDSYLEIDSDAPLEIHHLTLHHEDLPYLRYMLDRARQGVPEDFDDHWVPGPRDRPLTVAREREREIYARYEPEINRAFIENDRDRHAAIIHRRHQELRELTRGAEIGTDAWNVGGRALERALIDGLATLEPIPESLDDAAQAAANGVPLVEAPLDPEAIEYPDPPCTASPKLSFDDFLKESAALIAANSKHNHS